MNTLSPRLAIPEKKLGFIVLPSKEVPFVVEKDGAYFLKPKKGLSLNDQPVTTDQPLKDGDEVSLLMNFLGLKTTSHWVFQVDPVKAKADRIAAEKANGNIHELPEIELDPKDKKWFEEHFSADENIFHVDNEDIRWSELNGVLFFMTKKGRMSIGLMGAAVGALDSMNAAAKEAGGASEFDAAFERGTWEVTFSKKDKSKPIVLHKVDAFYCLVMAYIIDFYSPMDLITLFTAMAT